MTATGDEACDILRDVFDSGKLQHTKQVCEGDDVVMRPNGSLAFVYETSGDIQTHRHRKELVLGLNGHDAHSLAEANRILQTSPPPAD